MVESLDIQNLLQTGYYATSRAKSPKPSSSELESHQYSRPAPSNQLTAPRHYQTAPRPRRPPPPPPSVEDEDVSLRREHGTTHRARSSDEDTPSRGDVDQQPLIMEVHEYNPERRFVILTGPPGSSDGSESEERAHHKPSREESRTDESTYYTTSRRHEPPREERRAEDKTTYNINTSRKQEPPPEERRTDDNIYNANPSRRQEPPREERRTNDNIYTTSNSRRQDPPRDERRADNNTYNTNISRRPEPSSKPESNLKPGSGIDSDGSRPRLEKRKSRQDLPKLETEIREDQLPEKYRNLPPKNSSRPDPPPIRQPRPYPDPSLAPEVIKHGAGGREQPYHSYGQPSSSSHRSPTQRSYPSQPSDRRFEEGHNRASSASSATKRVSPNADSGKPARPLSNERGGDARYRGDYALPKSDRRERSPSYGRSERDDATRPSKLPSQIPSRESESRPGDDHPKGPRELQQRRRKSIVVQDGRESLPTLEKSEAPGGPRLRPKGPTMPLPIPAPSGFPDDVPANPRSSSTFPTSKQEPPPQPPERPRTTQPPPQPERSKTQLPYPVDDDPLMDPFNIRRNEWLGKSPYDTEQPISMPEIPLPIPIGPETPLEARLAVLTSGARLPATSQSWQPASFDPERDGYHLERPIGSVRRHSENIAGTGVPKFPDCRRKSPVAGKMDWLTLPRTDFNICAECYTTVFSNSEYRTFFQPMLRPSDRPISCDFGLSPWYRIAWLLTLKNDKPDLRLFHEAANVISATQNVPCPGDRTTTRNWLTIWNPYTRRPVYDFTICSQCARIIQALLPNLSGIFMPLSSRSEPIRGNCSMRFKARRKRFVTYFDAMETTSDLARIEQEEPDIPSLAKELEKITSISECHEDTPVANGYWHMMQFLRKFTVCGECFEEVVRPRLQDDNVIARNFYEDPQRTTSISSCQLYSPRMRDIFQKACRWNDPKYLETKVLERLEIERVIKEKLAKLDKSGHDDDWVEEQVDKLIMEWKNWE